MKLLRWLTGISIIIVVIGVIFFVLKVALLSKLTLYLLICFLLALYRIMRGPTAADRSVATDILGTLVVGFCAILAFFTKKSWYLDIAIAWALQSFISVLALAKFLEGKNFDE
ncbi:MAG: cation:proton antiporter [Candidatus Omnitrophica bacterium]|nr:cation:proton antiporter [Candidatus Omnitrophota bacterium]MCM8830882.1 cation:proton antiporter [Candidatus Omnitrophota bacterium]